MLLLDIAERASQIRFDGIPEAALATARLAILDTVGVTLAGSSEDCVRIVARAAGLSPGVASVFGTDRRAGILDAALVNGTASHALDFDDCSNTMGGHPSAPIVPALWALAERDGLGGRAFLEAYVAGFEVETMIGRAVNFHHYEKGWHPTATLGTFGAAAACSRLLGLDAEAFARALAIAASMASGLKANFGTMTKPFHVGHCSRNGLFAALLAAEGQSAKPGALEDPQGFLNVYNGAGSYDTTRLTEGFADPYDLVEPGVAFKRHPCCASTHPALDALLAIMADHGLQADDIASVRSWTHPRRLRHTNRPDPRSGLDGKFSVQYVLARAALEGSVRLDCFTDAAVRDPTVRAFMARIHAEPHPDAVMETDEHFFADVRVTTGNGSVFEAHVDRPLGRDRNHPLPPGALETKFDDCAALVMDRDAARAFRARILELDTVPDLARLGNEMRAGLDRPGLRLAGAF
ncbi:MAG: MmgE/PrpD family protein [Microvirga sp.]